MSGQIFTAIIAILVFNFVLERILEYLNDRRRSPDIPKEVEGIYEPEEYRRSQEYHKANSKFGLLSSTFSFVLMLVILFWDGFAWMDTWIRGVTEHPILMTLLFFGVLGFASDVIALPFSLYGTFVIEERFGFNKTTLRTYFVDKLKGYLLGGLIGGGLISLIVWFYTATGDQFWIYAWILVTVFTVFMTMFYATWIVPIFNKLTPLEDGKLRKAIVDYCKKAGFTLDNLYVIDGSKRSTKANAYFSGLGPRKRIVLYDTLIEKHTTEELVSVLAHEVGHYKKKHTLTSIVLSVLQTGVMLFILSRVISEPNLALALGAGQESFHLGILVFGLLYSPMSLVLGLAMNMLSRKNEFEADAFAMETANGVALQSALKRLSVDNLSNLTPHPAYVFFHYSHPPLITRLEALLTVEDRVRQVRTS